MAWNSSLTSASSRARPTSRGLQPVDPLRPADARHHPQRPRKDQRLGLALDLVAAGRLEGDRGLGRHPGGLVDEHLPGLRRRLNDTDPTSTDVGDGPEGNAGYGDTSDADTGGYGEDGGYGDDGSYGGYGV